MKSKRSKREEAQERNSKWANLTPEQQLADLNKRGLVARKQRAKLQIIIEAKKQKSKGDKQIVLPDSMNT